MIVVVFETEEEALESQQQDFEVFIAMHQNPEYIASTERWANVQQMSDGRWYYPVCPDCDYSDRVVVEYTISEPLNIMS